MDVFSQYQWTTAPTKAPEEANERDSGGNERGLDKEDNSSRFADADTLAQGENSNIPPMATVEVAVAIRGRNDDREKANAEDDNTSTLTAPSPWLRGKTGATTLIHTPLRCTVAVDEVRSPHGDQTYPASCIAGDTEVQHRNQDDFSAGLVLPPQGDTPMENTGLLRTPLLISLHTTGDAIPSSTWRPMNRATPSLWGSPMSRTYYPSQRGWRPRHTGGRSLCATILVGALLLLVGIGVREAKWYGTRRSPASTPPSKDRLDEVVACASWLSGHPVEKQGSPHRWRAIAYLTDGAGSKIDTADCKEPSSLFSTVYSLIVFRESLNVSIPSWNDSSDQSYYVKDLETVCRWKRVTCDRVGNDQIPAITRLSFNHADLSGTIPPELKGLWGLKALFLFSNARLQGSLPTELGLLTNLEVMAVHYSSLTGTIPSTLGRLSQLQELRVYDTKLTGAVPSEVCDLRTKALAILEADCTFLQCPCCTECKRRYPWSE